MKTKSRAIQLAMAAILATAMTSSLEAQTPATTPVEEIEAIEARANDYLGDLNKWDRAATLYRQAAALRGPSDLVAVENLVRAARLSYYEGNGSQATRDFGDAGRRALALGDVLTAANAFADAAWVADERGRGGEAHDYLSRAQLLANSPLLGEEERSNLLSRWEVSSQQQ